MDWNEVTERLLELLPPCGGSESEHVGLKDDAEPVSRYAWELASRIKDVLVEQQGKRPSGVYPTPDGAIVYEFARSESVLITVWVRSTEVTVKLLHGGIQKLKTMFEGPFEILDAAVRGIAVWLHNLLKSSTTVIRQSESFGGA